MWIDDYQIRLLDLPCSVKALVAMDEEGFYNVYVNSRLSREEQRKAVKHELDHVARDDFYNGLGIRQVEGA